MLNVTNSKNTHEQHIVHQTDTRSRHLTFGSDNQVMERNTLKTRTATTQFLKISYESWTIQHFLTLRNTRKTLWTSQFNLRGVGGGLESHHDSLREGI